MFALRYVIDNAAKAHIEALQNERNLSAHPILKSSLELFRPSKEAVLGHIINALKDVLVKSAMHDNKNMLDHIVDDIAANQDSFLEQEQLTRYLNAKYLDRINNEEEEWRIFRSLWRFVFQLDNEECARNRRINAWALHSIIHDIGEYILERIKEDVRRLETDIKFDDRKILKRFVKLLNLYPEIFDLLSEETKHLLKSRISREDMNNIAVFLSDSIEEHLTTVTNSSAMDSAYLVNYLKQTDNKRLIPKFIMTRLEGCCSFNDADETCTSLLLPRLKYFNDKEMVELLEVLDSNGQIYARWKAPEKGREIKHELEKRGIKPDWSQYAHLE